MEWWKWLILIVGGAGAAYVVFYIVVTLWILKKMSDVSDDLEDKFNE